MSTTNPMKNKETRCPQCVLENNNGKRDRYNCSNHQVELDRNADIMSTPMTKIREYNNTHNITPQEYDAIHYWLKYNFGRADKCENPDCSGKSKFFGWAKKHESPYARNRNNFMKLCYSCHRKYDTTEETRDKMRKINTGKKISEETKRRMSEAMKGRRMSPKNKAFHSENNRKPVAQLDDQGSIMKEWYSLRDASRYFKCDINTIKYAIKKGTKSRGFYWKFVPKSIRQHKEGYEK